MEFLSKTTKDTKELAGIIASKLKAGDIIFLKGDLGSGKTTFTGYLAGQLKIPARTQSPTFVIARKYTGGEGNIKTINHIDLYRLTTKEEVLDIGLEELVKEPNSVTVIEWPELAEEILSGKHITIKFENLGENLRKIYVENLH